MNLTFALGLSLINFSVNATSLANDNARSCEGDLKQEGPGTTSDQRGGVSISSNSRTASWYANEGWVVAFACVKGGSSKSGNGYVVEFGEGDRILDRT